MPTTTKIDTTLSVNAIGARTDFAGSDVSDISAEEFRFTHEPFSEGVLKPTDAYQVVAGAAATMEVIVGSGTAKTDYALVQGDIAGQGDYLVRLDDVTKTITLAAPDAAQDRTDEIYIVVLDDVYDASTFALPILAVRQGDVGTGGAGPDAAWESYMLLASVVVPGGSADITEATITDERVVVTVDVDVNTDRVATAAIQDSAVTTDKIADDNVTTPKILDAAVTTDKIADGDVTNPKIADGAVDAGTVGGNFLGSYIDSGGTDSNNNSALTGSFVDKAAVNFTLPAGWGSATIVAWGTLATSSGTEVQTRVEIGGSNGTSMISNGGAAARHRVPGVGGNVLIAIAVAGSSGTHTWSTISYIAYRDS